MHNYYHEITSDIKEAIDGDSVFTGLVHGALHGNYDALVGLYDALYDDLFVDDSVTGNGSGSYTMNRYHAQLNVCDNWDLCIDALREFDQLDQLGDKIVNGEWEWLDVTIRCYILGDCLHDVMSELIAA